MWWATGTNIKYYDALKETASRMEDLAKKLDGPKVELTPEDKQLIRLAVLPQVRSQLDEALYAFTVGKFITVAEGGQLYEFFRMAEDLKE